MKNISQFVPWFDEKETLAITEYMNEGNFLTEFRRTEQFETALANFIGARHVITVNNGTLSLWAILQVLGLQQDDEVIVPNYTMIATANAVRAHGSKIVFADVESKTLCLDLDQIKLKTTKFTKAIILVNANGRVPTYPINELLDWCQQRNIYLIEDSAQGLGSYYPDGTHVGLKGLVGSFSLSVPKIITTGQGGFLTTNNDEIAIKLRRFKDFGRSGGGNDVHEFFGLNLKFTDLQAVIGLVQLDKLKLRIEAKKKIWSRYFENLQNINGISLFEHNLEIVTPWFIDSLVEDREKLVSYLIEKGIGTRNMYSPITSQKIYKLNVDTPVTSNVGLRGLWLPSSAQLTEDEIDFVCKTIQEFYAIKG